jgi:hypothetical protein
MPRKYEQRTYMEPVGRSGCMNLFIVLLILAALFVVGSVVMH